MKPATTKPKVRTSTSARVTVVLEVTVGSWGPGCQLDQVYDQASEEAVGAVQQMIRDNAQRRGDRVRIVKLGAVEALTTRMDQR